LSKDGAIKVNKGINELYPKDLEDSIKSCTPGEWLYLVNERKKISYLAFVNPLVSGNCPVAQVIKKVDSNVENELNYLYKLIDQSIYKREQFKSYDGNSRLVYGHADYLPGLIVDSYDNYIIVQINTAGIDRFRSEIKKHLEDKFSKKVILLDNNLYRQREMLPEFEKELISDDIIIKENNLEFHVSADTVQKVGYYYDHRENRKRASRLIKDFKKDFKHGLDLFCYVGSWGLNLLNSDCEKMTFVDQGDFNKTIETNLKLNGHEAKGDFVRANVFDFIKNEVSSGKKYDLICSDPPAFCKSKKDERRAYDGYLKLHKNLMKMLEPNGVLLACSCTHYVDFNSFQKNIEEAAFQADRKVQLLDCGVQGYDHPTTNLNNKNTYLKYFAYLVE
jgi:23S rRNA (cytosine1962-C5)-methyltransferase